MSRFSRIHRAKKRGPRRGCPAAAKGESLLDLMIRAFAAIPRRQMCVRIKEIDVSKLRQD